MVYYDITPNRIASKMKILVSDPRDLLQYTVMVSTDSWIVDTNKIVMSMFPGIAQHQRGVAKTYVDNALAELTARCQAK